MYGVDNVVMFDVFDLFVNLLVIVERKLEYGGKVYIRVFLDFFDGFFIEVVSIIKEFGVDFVGVF